MTVSHQATEVVVQTSVTNILSMCCQMNCHTNVTGDEQCEPCGLPAAILLPPDADTSGHAGVLTFLRNHQHTAKYNS